MKFINSLIFLSAAAMLPGITSAACTGMYEGELEKLNGVPPVDLGVGLPVLRMHVQFHQNGEVTYTESALFPTNDLLGERSAIGQWKNLGKKTIEFAIFQSIVDVTGGFFMGCDLYACKNTIYAVAEFAQDCSSFQFKWHQTVLDATGNPAPSAFYFPGLNYVITEGSGVKSNIDDTKEILDNLNIPLPELD